MLDESEDGVVESLHAFIISDDGHLQMAFYFDEPADEETAYRPAESGMEQRQISSRLKK
jgi:hypothetical protein